MKYSENNHEKLLQFVTVVLRGIEQDLSISFWNQNQKEMDSPFGNTGNYFTNGVFSVKAYDWSGENDTPNFQWEDIKIYWYKYLGRGMYIESKYPVTPDRLMNMYEACRKSLRE